MNRSFRAPERGQMGSLRLKDNRDEDLALFREMRRREKEWNNLLQNSDEFDAPLVFLLKAWEGLSLQQGEIANEKNQKYKEGKSVLERSIRFSIFAMSKESFRELPLMIVA